MTKLVKVRIPERYGSFHAERPGERDTEYKGGDIALLTERQARDNGLVPIKDDQEEVNQTPPKLNQDVPPPADAPMPAPPKRAAKPRHPKKPENT
jgi:hypothetical protein